MARHRPNHRPLGFLNETDEEDELAYSLQRLFCTETQPHPPNDDPISISEAYSTSVGSGWSTGQRPVEWLMSVSDKRR